MPKVVGDKPREPHMELVEDWCSLGHRLLFDDRDDVPLCCVLLGCVVMPKVIRFPCAESVKNDELLIGQVIADIVERTDPFFFVPPQAVHGRESARATSTAVVGVR